MAKGVKCMRFQIDFNTFYIVMFFFFFFFFFFKDEGMSIHASMRMLRVTKISDIAPEIVDVYSVERF